MSTLTVIGATGRVGTLVTLEALARGHRVVALVRDPGRLQASLVDEPGLVVVPGEIDDDAAVRAAVAGSSAVIVAAGVRYRGRHPWSGIAGRPDVAPAAVRGVLSVVAPDQRVVLLSALGVGDSWPTLPAVVRWIISTSALRTGYAGLGEAEGVLHASGHPHTVVRAVTLTDGPATGRDTDGTNRPLRGNPKIARADVARLLLDVATADRPDRPNQLLVAA
jgi:uncharacterized protein YbjT (DUF2867 family)